MCEDNETGLEGAKQQKEEEEEEEEKNEGGKREEGDVWLGGKVKRRERERIMKHSTRKKKWLKKEK